MTWSAPNSRHFCNFLVAAGGGDHPGADRFGHLHDHRADAAGAAVDEQHFAGSQLRVAQQTQARGKRNQRDGRRLLVGHIRRGGVQPTFLDRRIFSERALPPQQALAASPHAIARFQPFCVWANRFDRAGQIAAHDKRKRQRHLHHAGADVGIDRIDAHRANFDQHLRTGCLRLGQIAEEDALGRSRLLNVSSLHGVNDSASGNLPCALALICRFAGSNQQRRACNQNAADKNAAGDPEPLAEVISDARIGDHLGHVFVGFFADNRHLLGRHAVRGRVVRTPTAAAR